MTFVSVWVNELKGKTCSLGIAQEQLTLLPPHPTITWKEQHQPTVWDSVATAGRTFCFKNILNF